MSLHFTAEAVTALRWNRLSDHIGRNPVVLLYLEGAVVSIVLFGLFRSFGAIIFRCLLVLRSPLTVLCLTCSFHRSRCLHGALKGNIDVMKSMMAELTDETNVVRGFSFLLMLDPEQRPSVLWVQTS
jgi:hypothetical protein